MTGRFAVLTPQLPTALSIVRIWGDNPGSLFAGSLPSDSSTHRTLTMRGVDKGVVTRSEDGSIVFTLHGGSGALDALRRKLSRAKYVEIPPPTCDADFARGLNPYRREALRLVPDAVSGAATAILLKALACENFDNLDREQFASDWTSVRPWLTKPRVAIAGEPNVGKSTLFNALALNANALVSDISGTTRDYLIADWTLDNGAVVELVDTAGIHDRPASAIEREGIRQGRDILATAHLVIQLAASPPTRSFDRGIAVASKCDAGQRQDWADLSVSAHTGFGLDTLAKRVAHTLFPPLSDRILPLSEEMADDAASEERFRKWFGRDAERPNARL